jgi:hypothetical protein
VQIKLLLEEKHLHQHVVVDPEPLKQTILDVTNNDSFFDANDGINALLGRPLTPSIGEGFARAISRNGEEVIELFLQIPNSRMFCTTCDERLVFTPIWYRGVTNELLGLMSTR